MAHKVVKVLKHDQVHLSGSVCLGTESGATTARAATSTRTNTDVDSSAQQARIVESNSEYSVIEIICGCGRKNYVQCNYADLAESEKPAAKQ